MCSVLDMEKAIEKLPEPDQRKLAAWFGEHRVIVENSATLGALYDDEEGGEGQTDRRG